VAQDCGRGPTQAPLFVPCMTRQHPGQLTVATATWT
jgi:hypothetical protein